MVAHAAVVAFLLDVVLVLAFAAVGRALARPRSPIARASSPRPWPFLVGAAVGLARGPRAPQATWPLDVGPGVTVWFATVVVGMLLRVIVLRSFAWPFLAVAAGVLALTLVGCAWCDRLGTRSTHA